MTTHKTIEDARAAAAARGDVNQTVKIEHAEEGICYINVLTHFEALGRALKARPMPEIKRLIEVVVDYKEEQRAHEITVHISTRGWGDYSSLVWRGDGRLDDAEIINQIRALAAASSDVDSTPSDEELRGRIAAARAPRPADPEPPARPGPGPGYCYSCGSYCYGDCGHYAPRKTARTVARAARAAWAEASYGMED